jgi:DNA-binding GntR family transcriptional regulator
MQTLLVAMAQAVRGRQTRAFFDANVAFTTALHTASANNTLMHIASGIEKQALRFRSVAYSNTHEMLEVAYRPRFGVRANLQTKAGPCRT